MSTHAFGRGSRVDVRVWHGLSTHWAWLACGFVLAFAVPFLFADLIEIDRDLFYGLYALAVVGLFALWSRSTGYNLVAAAQRHWLAALLLGLTAAGLLAAMVVRTDDAHELDPTESHSWAPSPGARDPVRGDRRTAPVRLPDPRRFRRVCRHSPRHQAPP